MGQNNSLWHWLLVSPLILLPCFVMLPLIKTLACLVNISSLLSNPWLPLPVQFKYFPFLNKSSSEIQTPSSTIPVCVSLTIFLSLFLSLQQECILWNFILTIESYTSLFLVQRLPQYWETCTCSINHYYLIDYKLPGMLWATCSF